MVSYEIQFKGIKKEKERNVKERLGFVKVYAEWIMKRPNEKWSKEHAEFINSVMATSKFLQKKYKKIGFVSI